MKKTVILFAALFVLAAGCHKAKTPPPPPPKSDYRITDKSAGIRTYVSEVYHMSFDFPAEFVLQETPPYNYTGSDKKLVTSVQINLSRGKDVKIYLTTNPQTTGCGSDAKKISSKAVQVNGQSVTRTESMQPHTGNTCVEYSGFVNGSDSVYMVSFISGEQTGAVQAFDALATSFQFLK